MDDTTNAVNTISPTQDSVPTEVPSPPPPTQPQSQPETPPAAQTPAPQLKQPDLGKALAMQMIAVKALSSELTGKLELGEAIDVVNRYLWELLEYSISTYIIFNIAEGRFESRSYVKESVSDSDLTTVKQNLADFIVEHSQDAVVGAVASISKELEPLMFGLPLDNTQSVPLKATATFPLVVGGKILGALNVSSSKKTEFSKDEKGLVELLISIASVSIARIHTVIQSLNSSTEALVQDLSNGVVMFDTNSQVTLANEAVTRFTGLPKEGYDLEELARLFVGINLMDLVHQALSEDKKVHIEQTEISRFVFEVSVIPTKSYSGNIMGGAVILHDITHIVEVDRAKTEFVSLASHQLRTPLSAIRWYSELLKSTDYGKLSKEQQEFIDVIETSNLRMISLVNALLNVSRIELGTFAVDPQDVDLVQVSKDVLNELQPRVEANSLQVQTSFFAESVIFRADPDLTRIILQNLLSNAVKYSKASTTVQLTITEEGEKYRLTVKDEGLGIPQSQQSQIFTKLFRADNAKEQVTDGTGLGLYIIRSIIESVGGKIWFESKEGIGTTFFVELPKTGMQQRKGSKPLEVASGS